MRWLRSLRPRWRRSSSPPATALAGYSDDGPDLPRHVLSVKPGEGGPSQWSCSCGDGGGNQPHTTIEQRILQHHLVSTAALMPLLNPRQLIEGLRRGVANRAPSQQIAVDLLITHGAWLLDARFRTFLSGAWSSTGDMTASVDWRRVAYALGVVDELLYDIKVLGPPVWMQPLLGEWNGLPEPSLIGMPEHDRSEIAVLRACAAIAHASTLDLNLVSAEVDPATRALITSAIARCIATAKPPIPG